MKKVCSVFMLLALMLVFGVCQVYAADYKSQTIYQAPTSPEPSDDDNGGEIPNPPPAD